MLAARLGELKRGIERFTRRDGAHPTAIAPLSLFRASAPFEPVEAVYEPALAIVAQGCKRVMLADEVYHYDPAHFLLVSVGLPVSGQVINASPDSPYLSLRIDLDPGQLSELILAAGPPEAHGRPQRGLAVSQAEPPLLDAVVRLLHLLDSPRDVGVLAPLVLREISYHLLVGEQGLRLRQIAAGNGQARRVATAIRWLKHNFAQPLRIEALAREVHMSPSGLHHQFKAVTAMSPLQYQKQVRLHEARRLMLSEGLDAATAGFRVGYESPSQFSREYRRLFGQPPQRDMALLRTAAQPEQDERRELS
ncbi:MAG TPA: AraC family transcriptional regulator [Gemmataceae bacterium]|nr:AraC family transcriptional regulator [Gemmataceae bacterium]